MKSRLLHTPEGVRDLYGQELQQKIDLQGKLLDRFHLYGYQDIQTPTFEYFDIFSSNIGTIPSRELYKFFDKEGNTLVLRPDFTPSIARCSGKYFMDEVMPLRFCYLGNTFMNVSDFQGRLKENTKIGAELINDDSVTADFEMISLMYDCMKCSGVKEFQITIGNVEFFKGLCEECGLDSDIEMDLREFISSKNYFGAEAFLSALDISPDSKEKILKVTELFGSSDIISEAERLVTNDRSKASLKRLGKLNELFEKQGLSEYITYDLSMLSKYNYYTGILFRAYTYGNGDAVMKGGRYDKLLSKFGKDAPAIGFEVVIDDLLMTLRRLGLLVNCNLETKLILYEENECEDAIRIATEYRKQGIRSIIMLKKDSSDLQNYIDTFGFSVVDLKSIIM